MRTDQLGPAPFTTGSIRAILALTTVRVAMVAVLTLAAPGGVGAGPATIGLLGTLDATQYRPFVDTLAEGLRERGYVEGRNITFAARYAEGRLDRLPALARELVALAAHPVRPLRQRHRRQGPGPDDPADSPAAGGRSDRVADGGVPDRGC